MDMEKILELFMENPASAAEMINALIDQYKPVAYSIGNKLLEIYRDYVDKDELYDLNARMQKKKFDAFVNAGFSEDQAMLLVLQENIKTKDTFSNALNKISVNSN